MHIRQSLLAAVFACGLSAGFAQAAQPAPAAAADHPKRVLIVLDAEAFDPGRVLAPPPPEGSDVQKAELAALHQIQTTRTRARLEQARQDGAHEDIFIYAAAIGPAFDLNALPATRRALQTVANDQAIIAKIAKDDFKRPRPYAVDPTIEGCEHSTTKPLTSYPSGHATLSYSLASVLTALLPQKADAIQARADDYAYSRLVCGVHYRSDLEAGRRLGTWIGQALLASPAFQPQLAAARAELKAAGFAR
jgi:acid phosphatase (class A)